MIHKFVVGFVVNCPQYKFYDQGRMLVCNIGDVCWMGDCCPENDWGVRLNWLKAPPYPTNTISSRSNRTLVEQTRMLILRQVCHANNFDVLWTWSWVATVNNPSAPLHHLSHMTRWPPTIPHNSGWDNDRQQKKMRNTLLLAIDLGWL